MNVELSLNQKQKLSQRMYLSMKILQMSALDLEHYLEKSALENPLIELEMPGEMDFFAMRKQKEPEWAEHNSVQSNNDASDGSLNIRSKAATLSDELLGQLPGFRLAQEEERVVRYLIENLDENGYLTISFEQLLKDISCDPHTLDIRLMYYGVWIRPE